MRLRTKLGLGETWALIGLGLGRPSPPPLHGGSSRSRRLLGIPVAGLALRTQRREIRAGAALPPPVAAAVTVQVADDAFLEDRHRLPFPFAAACSASARRRLRCTSVSSGLKGSYFTKNSTYSSRMTLPIPLIGRTSLLKRVRPHSLANFSNSTSCLMPPV